MTDNLFQKTLQDLVKGIRSNKKDPSAYISQSIAEIKTELNSTDPYVKSEGVRKLTYLQMIGYDISWAAFSIVEVMSQSRFAHKRIGYLAANQSFTESTKVILLTTNLFMKELSTGSSLSQYEIGLALNCLANIVTKELAMDCMSADVPVRLMNHTRPYVRKKAVLTLYKMYLKYPPGLRLTFDKLKERLDDSDSSVVSCAVNVICELSNKNPKNYLAMAPKFFRLLTTSSNNWMLIKVVKLMGSLVSEEPRLARKLLEPLATIIQNTGAKSLQYECIQTITECLLHTKREDGSEAKSVPTVVKLCSDYLRGFIEEHDQNLKYLGLVGLVSLLKSHPRHVVEHRELILKCLDDDDNTIRVRALELLAGIVSKKSLTDLVHHLLGHAKRAEGSYRDEIISKVLFMCSKEKFGLVTDFAWYVSVLLDLAVMQGSKHGKEVADQLIDVALRVDNARGFAVESMLSLLLNEKLILGVARQTVSEVLKAAAWIVGEYSSIVTSIANDTADDEEIEADENAGFWIEGPAGEDIRSLWRGQELHSQVIDALLNPRAANLPPHVQCAYIQAAMKVFIRACSDREEPEIASIIGTLRSRLPAYLQSQFIEVQERASTLRHILSEFGILSLDWETTAKKTLGSDSSALPTPSTETIIAESMKSGSKFLVDLLDPSAAINTVTEITKPVDDGGAKLAKLKARVLFTVIAEPFYAVHSKAQRKVPVPEGLSLLTPIKDSALQKLLQVDIPTSQSVSTIYFVYVAPFPGSNSFGENSGYGGTSNGDDKPDFYSDSQQTGYNSVNDAPSKFSSSMSGIPTSNPLPPPRNPDENLFYLSASSSIQKNKPIVPLSQVIADSFEEKKSKKSKKDKSSKSKTAEIDKREMLPAGAVSSDDELPSRRRSKKRSEGVSVTRKKVTDEMDLGSVDITTPLRQDEVLTLPKHREVPIQQPRPTPVSVPAPQPVLAPVTESHDSVGEIKKKKKSRTKEKDRSLLEDEDSIRPVEKKSSKSSRIEKTKSSVSEDLLSFDWITPATTSTSQALSHSMDLLGPSFSTEDHPTASHKSSKKEKSSKKKSLNVWLPLVNDARVDVFYAVSKSVNSGNNITVSFRAIPRPETTRPCGVDVVIGSVLPAFRFSNGTSSAIVTISQAIPPGGDESNSTEFIYEPSVFLNNTTIGVTVRISPASEPPVNLNSTIKIFVHSTFSPYDIDETGFSSMVSKTSNRWGAATSRVAFSGKAKSAMKAIAMFLQAHIVEVEYSRAVSLSSRTPSGGNVFCLIKWGKDTTFVNVDIKVLGNSKQESMTIAENIATGLTELRL